VVVNDFLRKKIFPRKEIVLSLSLSLLLLLASNYSVPHFLELLPDVMLPFTDPGIGWTRTAESLIAGPVSYPLDREDVETIVNLLDKLRGQGGSVENFLYSKSLLLAGLEPELFI
jgi:hypothetical protein